MFFSAVWRAIDGLTPLDLIPTRDTDYSLIPWRQNCYRFSELIIIYEIYYYYLLLFIIYLLLLFYFIIYYLWNSHVDRIHLTFYSAVVSDRYI